MSDRLRIGIIDDNEFVASALAAMIEEAGCVVRAIAHTLEAGWALVGPGSDCQIVFIDLLLDGHATGVELAQEAARNGRVVAVITGSPRLPEALSSAALLVKPFSTEQVRLVLHNLRSQLRSAAAA